MKFKSCVLLIVLLASLLSVLLVQVPQGKATVTISGLLPSDNTITLDTTPDFKCTPISNVSSAVNVTLYVNNVASGTVTNAANNTQVTITCNHTLTVSDVKKSWFFNVTDANGTFKSDVRNIGIGAYFKVPAVLTNPNASREHWTYYLNASAVNASSPAISIPDNNITLNGQYYTVSGASGMATGVSISRSSAVNTNIIVANITLSNWTSYWGCGLVAQKVKNATFINIIAQSCTDRGLALLDCDYNTLTNITANNNGRNGIFFDQSDFNTFTNFAANSNGYNGFYPFYSNSNTFTNVTVSNNNWYGFYLYHSSSNTIKNSNFKNNGLAGIIMSSAGNPANIFYNNLFNNTVNVAWEGTIYVNYWNTTKQSGTRINSLGDEIGGNFWTYPNGTGPSNTESDANCDGFLDGTLQIGVNNYDYLAYSRFKAWSLTFNLKDNAGSLLTASSTQVYYTYPNGTTAMTLNTTCGTGSFRVTNGTSYYKVKYQGQWVSENVTLSNLNYPTTTSVTKNCWVYSLTVYVTDSNHEAKSGATLTLTRSDGYNYTADGLSPVTAGYYNSTHARYVWSQLANQTSTYFVTASLGGQSYTGSTALTGNKAITLTLPSGTSSPSSPSYTPPQEQPVQPAIPPAIAPGPEFDYGMLVLAAVIIVALGAGVAGVAKTDKRTTSQKLRDKWKKKTRSRYRRY